MWCKTDKDNPLFFTLRDANITKKLNKSGYIIAQISSFTGMYYILEKWIQSTLLWTGQGCIYVFVHKLNYKMLIKF